MLMQVREREIFETLKEIKDLDFVLIGGYAVNTYTLPRFSVDCDIVVQNKDELKKIENVLSRLGYIDELKKKDNAPYHGNFERYEKKIEKDFKVNMDILVDEVIDRQTGSTFSADWIFKNSSIKTLMGKTILEKIKIRVIDIDALIVMKIISCRSTDIRDVFMLISSINNPDWVIEEISKRSNFDERLIKLIKNIESKQFKDGLQGVFGVIPEKTFEKHLNLTKKLKK